MSEGISDHFFSEIIQGYYSFFSRSFSFGFFRYFRYFRGVFGFPHIPPVKLNTGLRRKHSDNIFIMDKTILYPVIGPETEGGYNTSILSPLKVFVIPAVKRQD